MVHIELGGLSDVSERLIGLILKRIDFGAINPKKYLIPHTTHCCNS